MMLRPRRLLLTAICVLTVGLFCVASWINDVGLNQVLYKVWYVNGFGNSSEAGEIACYYNRTHNTLPELRSPVAHNTSIFFIETSCHKSPGMHFTARQACAVESAAKMNPSSEVYVLFPSPIVLDGWDYSAVVRQLLSYQNVRLRHINMDQFFHDTPLQEWYESGILRTSRWPRSHASDVLRYLTLWKYGGIYLDLDVVVIKALTDVVNYAGAESTEDVAAGVLSLATEGEGHIAATALVNELRLHFRGYDWGYNGPGVITRVLTDKMCHTDKVTEMTPSRCKGFTVFPPETFYPIPWKQWALYFNNEKSEQTMRSFAKSRAIHVWNKFSIKENVTVGSRQPYGLVASQYCPRVYSHVGEIF